MAPQFTSLLPIVTWLGLISLAVLLATVPPRTPPNHPAGMAACHTDMLRREDSPSKSESALTVSAIDAPCANSPDVAGMVNPEYMVGGEGCESWTTTDGNGCGAMEGRIDGGASAFRVLSWNILAHIHTHHNTCGHGGPPGSLETPGQRDARHRQIAHTLMQIQPDIIILQEVDTTFMPLEWQPTDPLPCGERLTGYVRRTHTRTHTRTHARMRHPDTLRPPTRSWPCLQFSEC